MLLSQMATLILLLSFCSVAASAQEHYCAPVAASEMLDLHTVATLDTTTWVFGSYGACRRRTGANSWNTIHNALPDTIDIRAATVVDSSILLVGANGSIAIANSILHLQFQQQVVSDVLALRSATFGAARCGSVGIAVFGSHLAAFHTATLAPVSLQQPSSAQFNVSAFTISSTAAILLYRKANDSPAMVLRARLTGEKIAFDTLAIGDVVSDQARIIDSVSLILSFDRSYSTATVLSLTDGNTRTVSTDAALWLTDVPPILVLDTDGRPRGMYSAADGLVYTLLADTVFSRTTMPRGHVLPEDLVRGRPNLYTDHSGGFVLPRLGGGLFCSDLRLGYVTPSYQPRRLLRAATTPFGQVTVHSSSHLSAIVDGVLINDEESMFALRLMSSNSGRTWIAHELPTHVATTLGMQSAWCYLASADGAYLGTSSNDSLVVWHVDNRNRWTLHRALALAGRPLYVDNNSAVLLEAGVLIHVNLLTGTTSESGTAPASDLVAEAWASADTFALVSREGIASWSTNGGRSFTSAIAGCTDGLASGGTFGLDGDSVWCTVQGNVPNRPVIGKVDGVVRRGGLFNNQPVYFTGPSRVEYSRVAIFNTNTLEFDSSTVVRRRPPATFNPEFHALVQGAPGIAVRQTNGVIDVVTDAPLSNVHSERRSEQQIERIAVWNTIALETQPGNTVRIVDASGTVVFEQLAHDSSLAFRPYGSGLYVAITTGNSGTTTQVFLVLQ